MSEVWKKVYIEELAVGDVVENPANQAGETVVRVDVKGGWVQLVTTGFDRWTPCCAVKILKLFPKKA